jgi:hypothetical protein
VRRAFRKRGAKVEVLLDLLSEKNSQKGGRKRRIARRRPFFCKLPNASKTVLEAFGSFTVFAHLYFQCENGAK